MPRAFLLALRFVATAALTTFDHIPGISDVATALIVTNVLLSTILIAGKIWYMQWQNSRLTGLPAPKKWQNRYLGIVLLIIESGAIYALSQILSLILDDVHNQGVHTVLDMHIPLAGMLPTLIVLVVHFDLVPGTHTTESYGTASGIMFQSASERNETTFSTTGVAGLNKPADSLRTQVTSEGRKSDQYPPSVSDPHLDKGLGDV
ncbi:hypothetical protein GALMADRAFT_145944 [Galerina marginata CBS 339.88]|uniref:DUF202 domain-containing protein n=1 Tax=Galerina marginata (strain CBS 339.88) TaxID=685588 RepID=A0A067SG24_GALM3|nr:hypothetical protein GALMADRAFT_145944 [Galerina marginata CBS 339.88]